LNRELRPRLLAVAEAIPKCVSMVDCGCDHGYVSIYAAKKGIAQNITASDVNEGPLANAEGEIAAEGLSDRIATRLCDGLRGLSPHECVVIAGMGGETIIEIIDAAPWTKNCKALILQPMTKIELLREYLYREGFAIYSEKLVREGRLYNVISARFEGKTEYLPYEKYISRACLSDSLAAEYADGCIKRLRKELESRIRAGSLTEEERTLRELDLKSLTEMREKL